MIIWRGWGILALLVVGVSIALGIAMAGSNRGMRGIFVGLVMVAGAVGTWFLSQHLNVTQPKTEFEKWYAQRSMEVGALVRGGAYNNVEDPQRPGQFADPNAVGNYVLQQEATKVRAALTNRHSLFFIPMQYLAYVIGGLGVVFMVANPFA